MTTETMSPAAKAWATRRARKAATDLAGFEDAAACDTIRGRFLESGADALADADLLSVLVNSKAQADKLIAEFGSFAETIAAPAARLSGLGLDAVTIAKVRAIYASVARVLHGEIKARPVLSSWSAVLDYLRAEMAFEPVEQFRVLFLDKRNVLIANDKMHVGTVDHTPVYPREVARRALEVGATAIVLTHNHPSGDTTPSQADVQMTRLLIDILKPLGISVHDHIVIGKGGHASLKGLKLI